MMDNIDTLITAGGVALGALGIWFTKVKKLLRQVKELVDVGIATSNLFDDVIEAYEDDAVSDEEFNQIIGEVRKLRMELNEFQEIIK